MFRNSIILFIAGVAVLSFALIRESEGRAFSSSSSSNAQSSFSSSKKGNSNEDKEESSSFFRIKDDEDDSSQKKRGGKNSKEKARGRNPEFARTMGEFRDEEGLMQKSHDYGIFSGQENHADINYHMLVDEMFDNAKKDRRANDGRKEPVTKFGVERDEKDVEIQEEEEEEEEEIREEHFSNSIGGGKFPEKNSEAGIMSNDNSGGPPSSSQEIAKIISANRNMFKGTTTASSSSLTQQPQSIPPKIKSSEPLGAASGSPVSLGSFAKTSVSPTTMSSEEQMADMAPLTQRPEGIATRFESSLQEVVQTQDSEDMQERLDREHSSFSEDQNQNNAREQQSPQNEAIPQNQPKVQIQANQPIKIASESNNIPRIIKNIRARNETIPETLVNNDKIRNVMKQLNSPAKREILSEEEEDRASHLSSEEDQTQPQILESSESKSMARDNHLTESTRVLGDDDFLKRVLKLAALERKMGIKRNKTKIINWKIVNHGRQTIIIL